MVDFDLKFSSRKEFSYPVDDLSRLGQLEDQTIVPNLIKGNLDVKEDSRNFEFNSEWLINFWIRKKRLSNPWEKVEVGVLEHEVVDTEFISAWIWPSVHWWDGMTKFFHLELLEAGWAVWFRIDGFVYRLLLFVVEGRGRLLWECRLQKVREHVALFGVLWDCLSFNY